MDFIVGTLVLAATFAVAGYLVWHFPPTKRQDNVHWYRGRKR